MFSIWETREKDYDAFVKETKTPWERPPAMTNGLEPAVRVSWNDAKAFCQWLTDRERRSKVIGNSVIYRLPTDHEWSCAVGVGELENPAQLPVDKKGLNPTVFPWGANWPPPPGAGNYQGKESVINSTANLELLASTSYDDGFRILAPVGSFSPNGLGLYDMGGNAWEWCDDWFDASQQTKVGRGSSFDVGARKFLTSSYRIPGQPDQVRAGGGFRVVMAPSNVAVKTTSDPPPATSKPTPPPAGQPFTNTLGMKFVPVPGTKVLVCIHETRRCDYVQFATAMPGRDESWIKLEHRGVPVGDKDDHPATGVSWDDARAFCAWLSGKEKLSYRLPTDHEWSCAVGIGDEEAKTPGATPEQLNQQIKNEYPWGKSFPPPDKRGNLADRECGKTFSNQTIIGNYNDGFATTAPVMSFKPNAFGIYDLEGNVSEWCSDLLNDKMQFRVFRGGHWLASASNYLLSSARMQNSVIAHIPILGFRVVVETAP
jgi:formylglycine-generating enzyme required for sulfatase activity